jgi:alpha-glucosidase
MELVEVAAATILPVVRHPFIHYPDDPEVCGLEHQFMVGPDLMVAPVLDPDQRTVEVYLPAGLWVHLWSGEEYGSAERGVYETVQAPTGKPAVFFREGSEAGGPMAEELERRGLL